MKTELSVFASNGVHSFQMRSVGSNNLSGRRKKERGWKFIKLMFKLLSAYDVQSRHVLAIIVRVFTSSCSSVFVNSASRFYSIKWMLSDVNQFCIHLLILVH